MKSIIFIPGIEATALVNANTFDFGTVWNAYDNLPSAIGTKLTGLYMEEALQLDPQYDSNISQLVERNHIANLPYKTALEGLSAKLKAQLYLFGYDWRLSNIENGRRLKRFFYNLRTKINNLLPAGETNEFYFLTHSMGGLVFMNFVNELQPTDYADIAKIILIAPPLQGSPYALIHMVQEESGFKGLVNAMLNRTIDVRKVMRTFPSIYELLPTYPGAVTYADDHTDVDLLNINNWQSNLIKDNDGDASLNLFTNRLNMLAQYRNRTMKFPDVLGNKSLIIAGAGDNTITNIKVERNYKNTLNYLKLDNASLITGSGDGTVPIISSSALRHSILTLAVNKQHIKNPLVSASFHGLMLRESSIQNIIKRFFENDTLYTPASDISALQSLGEGVEKV